MDGVRDLRRRDEPEVCGHARFEERPRTAAVLAPCGRVQRLHPQVGAAAPVTRDRARAPGSARRGRRARRRRSSCRRRTRSRHPTRRPFRPEAPRTCRCRRATCSPSRAPPPSAASLLVREVDAREQEQGCGRRFGRRGSAIDGRASDVERTPRPRGGGASSRGRARRRAPRRRRARARRRSSSCRRRPRARAIAAPPPREGQRRAARRLRDLADERVREQRLARVTGSRVTAAPAASRSYAATCWTRPSSSGASGACGSGSTTPPAHARGHLDDVVVREAGERAVVSHVDLVHDAVVAKRATRRARPPPRCRTRRRAARGAPASWSKSGRDTSRAAGARSRRPPLLSAS